MELVRQAQKPQQGETVTGNEEWNSRKSAELYGINYWGSHYFRVNEIGHVEVTPAGPTGPALDLYHLVADLRERGIRVPILLRFPDIVRSRVDLLNRCFAKAVEENKYSGKYCGVYPIKVNQQRHLVEEIVEFGQNHAVGLEAGSKPELMICLAMMDTPSALIICNGFKDEDYIEMALISQKLGRNTIIVVDRYSELKHIIDAGKRLDIKPKIGFRTKLNTPSAGRWAETAGAKSKFGLTPSEIVRGIEYLKSENALDCLELLAFLSDWQSRPVVARAVNLNIMNRMMEFQRDKAMAAAPIPVRIAQFLLASLEQQPSTMGNVIGIRLTRKDIAERVGTTVETAIRVLSSWGQKNWVATEDHRIMILDRKALEDLIQEGGG